MTQVSSSEGRVYVYPSDRDTDAECTGWRGLRKH